jgi:hypothetical protein
MESQFEDVSVRILLHSCSKGYRLIICHRGLEHSADPEEIEDLETYLKERIPPLGEKPSGL